MRKLFFLFLFFAGAWCAVSAQDIVRDGKAASVVLLPEKSTLTEDFAAEQLVYWVREITGCTLEVVRTPSAAQGNIRIGRSFAEGKFAADLETLKDSEGFAVRSEGKDLYLFGARSVGTVFAVFDLLEKNTDIIWPSHAEGIDRVFTKTGTLAVTKTNYAERPVIAERCWGVNNGYYYNHPRTEYFCLRQKTNATNGDAAPRKRFGFNEDECHCHNLWRYLPWEKYKDSHPEYYCLVDGVRVKPGYAGNLCFTAPGGAEEFAKNFMRDKIENDVPRKMAGIGIEDTNITCSCPECLKPIVLPDGRVLKEQDNKELFRSTQYYLWLNRIAREIAKKYPDFKIATIAYMFTMEPPAVRLEKNLFLVYCPINKNLKEDFNGKTNTVPLKQLRGWNAAVGSSFGIYEYYGCAADYPRPASYVIQRDLKIMSTMKIHRIYSEWIMKNNAEFLSAMDFWVTCRLLWNPNQDIEQLRSEFIRRTFRGAADDMQKFFDIIRDTWYADGASSFYYDNAVKSTGYYLLGDPAAEKACFDALRSALDKADHPVSKLFVQKILTAMETYAAEAKKRMAKSGTITIPFVNDASLASIEGGAWANAYETPPDSFVNLLAALPKPPLVVPLSVRIAHDGKTLWFKFHADCVDDKVKKPTMWSREHWEIFLQTDRSNSAVPYYHFAFDTAGEKYTAISYGMKCDLQWKVSISPHENNWEALVSIPMEQLNIKDGTVRIHFLHHAAKVSETSTWNTGSVHEPGAFTKAIIGK